MCELCNNGDDKNTVLITMARCRPSEQIRNCVKARKILHACEMNVVHRDEWIKFLYHAANDACGKPATTTIVHFARCFCERALRTHRSYKYLHLS